MTANSFEESSDYDVIYHLLKNYSSEILEQHGYDYVKQDDLENALICFTIISNRYINNLSAPEKKRCAEAYGYCGAIYYYYANYTKAYTNYLKAIDVCEEVGYKAYMNILYNNIAGIFYLYGDYAKSEKYLELSYRGCLEDEDWFNLMIALHNMMKQNNIIAHLQNMEERILEFKQLDIPQDNQYKYALSIANGTLNILNQNYEKAAQEFEESINYTDNLQVPKRQLCSSYFNIAKAYSLAQQYDSAIEYIKKGEAVAIENDYPDLTMDAFKTLRDYYEIIGNEQVSIDYRYKHLHIKDSILNATEFGKIKDLQSFYELEKIETQVHQLTAEQKQKNKILLIITLALIVVVLSLLWIFRQNRRLAERNKDLFLKNVEAMKSEEAEKLIRKEFELTAKSQKERIKKYEEILKASHDFLPNIRQNEIFSQEEGLGENQDRYKGSRLSDEYKTWLLEAIRNVMDKTTVFYSPDFSLEKLALLVDSNTSYVSQVINEQLGKNFNTFMNEYRISEARKRLMDFENYGNLTIEAISFELGFNSRTSFIRAFKKITGLTPTEYQKMAKQLSVNSKQLSTDSED